MIVRRSFYVCALVGTYRKDGKESRSAQRGEGENYEHRRDADVYEKESFAAVTHILEPFLVLPPVVKNGAIDERIPEKLVSAVGT